MCITCSVYGDGYWLRMCGWCGTLRLRITRASPLRYFWRQVSRYMLCFLPHIERAPIQRSSRQGQSVKILPTCEADERYGGLKLMDRAMLAVCSRQGRLL